MHPGTYMRSLPLGAAVARRLPIGLYGLGDDGDDSDDDIDAGYAVPDYGAPVESSYSIPDIPAPDIGTDETPIDTGFTGPVEPGEVELGSSPDLNTAILTGTIAPPTGSALTSAQAATLNAAGASSTQVGQILSGQTSYLAVLASLSQVAGAAAKVAATVLPATSTGLRPSPVTCPTAPAGYAYTLNATNQCILGVSTNPLTQASVISGVPNWMLLLLAAGAAMAFSAGGK